MSIYSNVTEEDLNILRKLKEQQKKQHARKIKNRVLGQTHDIKLEESLSPINKNLSEVKNFSQTLGETITENNTAQLAIENTQNEEIHPSVIYDILLTNTKENMKKQRGVSKREEDQNGQMFLNLIPFKLEGYSRVEIEGKNLIKLPIFKMFFLI